MKSYFEAYLKLPHLRYGKAIDLETIKSSITDFFSNTNLEYQQVAIADDDPIRLALVFLYLIDQKAIPLTVPVGFSHVSDYSFCENLKWKHKTKSRLSSIKESHYICLSSGTTGEPKPLALSFAKALKNAQSHAEGFQLKQAHTIVQILPVYHSYGIVAYILTPLVANVGVDFCSGLVGLRSFKSEGERVLHISPSQARFILKDKFEDPKGISKITIGAGTLTFDELNELQQKFSKIQFYVSYGLTEAGPRVTAGLWNQKIQRKSSIGKPWIGQALPGVGVAIYDGKNIRPQGTGLLCIKTVSLCLNIAPQDVVDGWLKTRDQVTVDDEDIFFLSRGDDIIKCGGVTLFPAEMENSVRQLDGVHDVIMLKRMDPLYEEVPILFVEGSISKNKLEQFVADNWTPAIAPRAIYIMQTFPRQSLNKVDRAQLHKMMESHSE